MNNAKKIFGKNLYLFGMKYQINQSRLDELVMDYLDSVFFGMEEQYDAVGGGVYRWWGKGNDRMIDIDNSTDNGIGMGIQKSIWDGLKSMFHLSTTKTDEYFMRWIEENLELYPDEIYTF